MSRVEIADRETYSPTLSNLGLRTLGYKLDSSDLYDANWNKGLAEFCSSDDRIKTLADRVAISLFADLYGRDVFRPHNKGEAEEFAMRLLDSGPWKKRMFEFLSWYLPNERQELFQTISTNSGVKHFDISTSYDGTQPSYGEQPELEFETTTTEIQKYGAEPILGSDHPADLTLPELGIKFGRLMNEEITNCESLNPGYDEDQIFDTAIEAEQKVTDAGYYPDLILISAHVDEERAVPSGLRTVEDKYLSPSEFIIADSDRLGFQVVAQEWDVEKATQSRLVQRGQYHDPDSTLGFQVSSRQSTVITNEDAACRGVTRSWT